MNRRHFLRLCPLFLGLASLLVFGQIACRKAEPGPQPPVAEKIRKEFQEFGKTRVDNYYWLRDRDNPKVV
ncbi:MAG: oligopeptidase, partial [Candidatus Aminicenantes bacterium]|nr:oligopeptidase [Candidatus Aminicenantes bacterium]